MKWSETNLNVSKYISMYVRLFGILKQNNYRNYFALPFLVNSEHNYSITLTKFNMKEKNVHVLPII